MSLTKVDIISTINTSNTLSLVTGKLILTTSPSSTIDVLPVAPIGETANIILQKGYDDIIKGIINSYPVRESTINVYDQSGFLTNKYLQDRRSNDSGELKITSDDKGLISEIKLPDSPDEQNYLILTSYSPLVKTFIPSSRKTIINEDIKRFRVRNDTSKIIVFITKEINDAISSCYNDDSCYTDDNRTNHMEINTYTEFKRGFKDYVVVPMINMAHYVAEYLLGNSIAGSKPGFQGMLMFDSTEVIGCKFHSPTLKYQPRSGGRIQFNTTDIKVESEFIIILKHVGGYIPSKITEGVTATIFDITSATTLPDLSTDHINSIINGCNFLSQIRKVANDYAKFKEFLSTHKEEYVTYSIESPLYEFYCIESECNISTCVINYAIEINSQIISYFKGYDNMLATHYNTKKYMFMNPGYKPIGQGFGQQPFGQQQLSYHAPSHIPSFVERSITTSSPLPR